jgi:uncharacterized integral membrane protein
MPPGAAEPPLPPDAAEPPMPGPPTSLGSGADDYATPGTSLESQPDEPAGSGLDAVTGPDLGPGADRPAGEETRRQPIKLTPTRTSAMWLGVWAGVLVVILLIIFVAQNTAGVEINFLWMSGRISLALAMLIAGVAGAVVAMAVAAARIIQLRRMVRRAR